jgi:hypothetical protein
VEALNHDLFDLLSPKVRAHLSAATAVAAHHERSIRWEINCVERALKDLEIPVLLLKGAAYAAAVLPPAKGRLASDIDIMVPYPALDRVEAALENAGWEPIKLDPYDQRYYRTWMHELPPLRHRDRRTVVDVHHAILPTSARLGPDPRELWAMASRLDEGLLHVLAPADMVLHSAVHLFYDGDLYRALRGLVDIGDLLTHFGRVEPDFWPGLVPRATALGLGRPLFYALRYCHRLLASPIPRNVMTMAATHAPAPPVTAVMDRLVPRVLIPRMLHRERDRGVAAMALYIRSHWLRMPPWLLTRHLAHQAIVRFWGNSH